MYQVAVTRDFIANHYLIGGDWGAENEPHAHHYVLEFSIEGEALNEHGYLLDIVDIEEGMQKVVAYFRDDLLNDKPEFAGLNPSLEHFSRILSEMLHDFIELDGEGLTTVKLWENETCWAAYRQRFG